MLRFKFGAWAVVLMLAALSFGACSDEDDDPAFNPPSNITEALKQLYPAAQNIEWEMKDVYYVADCWVADDELEVWFDGNANWLMTENELESIDSLVPAVYTAFNNTKYSSWVVTGLCTRLSAESYGICHSGEAGKSALFTGFLAGWWIVARKGYQ